MQNATSQNPQVLQLQRFFEAEVEVMFSRKLVQMSRTHLHDVDHYGQRNLNLSRSHLYEEPFSLEKNIEGLSKHQNEPYGINRDETYFPRLVCVKLL